MGGVVLLGVSWLLVVDGKLGECHRPARRQRVLPAWVELVVLLGCGEIEVRAPHAV